MLNCFVDDSDHLQTQPVETHKQQQELGKVRESLKRRQRISMVRGPLHVALLMSAQNDVGGALHMWVTNPTGVKPTL